MNPSWRTGAGMALILLLIAAWSVISIAIYERIAGAGWAIEALFFLVAGTVWVLPLKPLLRWMQVR